MKLSREKIDLQMARKTMNHSDIDASVEVDRGWATNVIWRVSQGNEVTPKTAGLLARALGCDPGDLIADQN